jgi:hypothetical protein
MTILDKYFELSDLAGNDNIAFQELINLFSDQAVLHSADGTRIDGKQAIKEFFHNFFTKNIVLKHVWTTKESATGLETTWAVVGKRSDEAIFALKGIDIAELDYSGKILSLKVCISM